MRAADYVRLVALAAIWGGAFIFMRVTAPVLGPVVVADARVLIAGLALIAWFRYTGFDTQWRRFGWQYVAIGVVNMALPSLFYSFAALHIPASLASIVNATAPMFGALFGAALLGERLNARKIIGFVLGVAGVALVARPEGFAHTPMFGWAVAACIAACVCYGYTGVLIRKHAADAPSPGIAAMSQLAAGVLILPAAPFFLPGAAPSLLVTANLLALGLLCGAVGFLMYFRLIADTGATNALTVTYLIPPFGILWGMLFLGETLPPGALAGAVLILAGTVLVTRG